MSKSHSLAIKKFMKLHIFREEKEIIFKKYDGHSLAKEVSLQFDFFSTSYITLMSFDICMFDNDGDW